MYCSECGNKAEKGDKFCKFCGNPISLIESPRSNEVKEVVTTIKEVNPNINEVSNKKVVENVSKDFKKCPHCNANVLQVLKKCPLCKRSLKNSNNKLAYTLIIVIILIAIILVEFYQNGSGLSTEATESKKIVTVDESESKIHGESEAEVDKAVNIVEEKSDEEERVEVNENKEASEVKTVDPQEDENVNNERLSDTSVNALRTIGIADDIAIGICDVFEEFEIPIWDEKHVVSIEENTNVDDFILGFSAVDGSVTLTYVAHILSGKVVEVVDSNMEVIYTEDGLNDKYLFYSDTDILNNISVIKLLLTEQILKSPSTAEFSDTLLNPYEGWSVYKNGRVIQFTSYVDSMNSFGAMIRSDFVIEIIYNLDGSSNIIYVEFEGDVLADKR